MILSTTTDILMNRANEIGAISNAVYEADFKDECNELAKIAGQLARVSASMREKIDAMLAMRLQTQLSEEIVTTVDMSA